MGCFAKGCLSLVIAVALLAIVCVFGGWFMLKRAVTNFTSTEPVTVAVQTPSAGEVQTAEEKKQTLHGAIRNRQETTVSFTADDLNALIATDPDFHGLHNHARVSIENSLMTVELSAPLSQEKLKMFRDRWFNGRLTLGLSYVDDKFAVDIKSGEANGHQIPSQFLTSQAQSELNRRLNDKFQERPDSWTKHVKMASVQNDQLVITTRGQ